MNSKVNSKRDFSLGREYPRGNFRIVQSRTVIRQCALTILRTWNSCPSKNWRKPKGFTNVKVSVIGQVVTEKVTLRFRLGSFKGVGFAQHVLCGQLEELDNAFVSRSLSSIAVVGIDVSAGVVSTHTEAFIEK